MVLIETNIHDKNKFALDAPDMKTLLVEIPTATRNDVVIKYAFQLFKNCTVKPMFTGISLTKSSQQWTAEMKQPPGAPGTSWVKIQAFD